jgi:hypothetical protein
MDPGRAQGPILGRGAVTPNLLVPTLRTQGTPGSPQGPWEGTGGPVGTQGALGGTQGPWALKLIPFGTWAQMGTMGPRDPGGPLGPCSTE